MALDDDDDDEWRLCGCGCDVAVFFANEASGHSQGAPRQSQGEKKATEGLAQ